MTARRLLLGGLLMGASLLGTTSAHAVTYDRYDVVYDAAGSMQVGRPCYYKTWTHVDTAAVPPARVVVDHYCTF
jgi:hypothetical protein